MYYTIYSIFTTFLILSRDCLLLLDIHYVYTYIHVCMYLIHIVCIICSAALNVSMTDCIDSVRLSEHFIWDDFL